MRKMTNGTTTLNITKLIVTQHGWEYFVTDNKFSDDIVQCLVCGLADEIGDVSLKEIRPYVVAATTNLSEVMPAPNWEWVS